MKIENVYVGDGKKYFKIKKLLEASNMKVEDIDFICNEYEAVSLANQKVNCILRDLNSSFNKVNNF